MQKLVCELCNSNNFTKEDDGYFVCDYCRTKYTPAQAQSMLVEGTVSVDRTGDIPSLISIATTSLNSNNNNEAYDYANKILEIDPQNSFAWQVKGIAAGKMSSLEQLRFTEMLSSFTLAIEKASHEDRGTVSSKCAQEARQIAMNLHTASSRYATEFSRVQGSWEAHVACSEECVQALLNSYKWDAQSGALLDLISIESALIIGIPYSVQNRDSTFSSVRQLTPAQKSHAQMQIAWAGTEMRKTDPTYVTPSPQTRAKDSKCFVVTATVGDENAMPVVTLREFRDSVLVETRVGLKFIGWYYKNGPHLARLVEKSFPLRCISFALVVAPSTLCALVVLRLQKRR